MSKTGVEQKQGPRLSWMAVISFLSGMAFWPIYRHIGDPCMHRTVFYLGLILPVVAVVLGCLAPRHIKRSQGRLKGQSLEVLGIVLGLIGLFAVGSLPVYLVDHERMRVDQAFRTLHQAEERYRVLYPDVGYSPDLRSLGPPASGASPSAERAGLVNADLGEGLYHQCIDPLSYAPRTAADGKTVGYTVRAEAMLIRVMDETGEVRIDSRIASGKKPRK